MGVYTEKAEKEDKKKLPNGKDVKKSKKPPQESSIQEKENVTSCCQGANGFSCCRDGSLEDETAGKKGQGRLSAWVGKWEQSDVLAAVAVVGAVATVAVAYSFYRRSG
uniref:Sucrase/ferredoxin-like family protein n=2 Tax=Davidia involucrata TaxID=16924 RepID=A0A5B7AV92_DAVIN